MGGRIRYGQREKEMNSIIEAKVDGRVVLRMDAWQIILILMLHGSPAHPEHMEVFVDGKKQEPPPET